MEELPEIRQEIFNYLSIIDWSMAICVCKTWETLIISLLSEEQLKAKKEKQRKICAKHLITNKYCHSHKYGFISKRDLCNQAEPKAFPNWPRSNRDIIKYGSSDLFYAYIKPFTINVLHDERNESFVSDIFKYRSYDELMKIGMFDGFDKINGGDFDDLYKLLENKDYKYIIKELIILEKLDRETIMLFVSDDINDSDSDPYFNYTDIIYLDLLKGMTFIDSIEMGSSNEYFKTIEEYFRPSKDIELNGRKISPACGIWLLERGYKFTLEDILTFDKGEPHIKRFYCLCGESGYFD